MDKEDVVCTHIYTYTWILLSHKKEWNCAICSNMDRPRDYHAMYVRQYYLYVESKICYKWTYLLSRNRLQSFSRVWLFATPWTAALQASLSITNSRSPPKPMSIELVMPSNHLNLCRPLLLLPSIFPSVRVFSNESALRIRWPKCWSFSFNISPSNEHPGLISLGWTGWISLQSKGLSRVFSNTTLQKHQFFGAQFSLWSNSHIHTCLLEKP